MEKQIRLKTVIFYSVVILITIVAVELYLDSTKLLNFNFLYKRLDKITAAQKIAPQRLFVNVWRTVRNEYVDSSMNRQNWMRWRNRYLKNIKTMDDANVAINTMLISLNDPYTKFLMTELYTKQQQILDSKVYGVGIIFNNNGNKIVVDNVLENSPAQKNQILPGDTIVSINGRDVSKGVDNPKILFDNISDNNAVNIKVKRDNKIIERTLKKSEIPIKTMKYKILPDKIAIISLATIMGEKAIKDFIQIIKITNNAKTIILDLRDNYGGILSNAIEMANYMLDEEKILSIESRGNNKLQIYASNENIFKKKNIIILVNKNTASAAEILAGTLKDNLGAVIIGENTYGKNSIQQVIPMPNNTGLIVTSNKYILPNGEDIHNTGISPDIYMRDRKTLKYNMKQKDVMMEKAIEIARNMMKNEK